MFKYMRGVKYEYHQDGQRKSHHGGKHPWRGKHHLRLEDGWLERANDCPSQMSILSDIILLPPVANIRKNQENHGVNVRRDRNHQWKQWHRSARYPKNGSKNNSTNSTRRTQSAIFVMTMDDER